MSNQEPTGFAGDLSECDEYLQAWLEEQDLEKSLLDVGDPPTSNERDVGSDGSALKPACTEAEEHVKSCERCSAELTAMRKQAALLSAHFAEFPIPARPALEPRAPLQAASGYPRRVSLNVLPFMLLMWLLVLLGISALGWYLVARFAS